MNSNQFAIETANSAVKLCSNMLAQQNKDDSKSALFEAVTEITGLMTSLRSRLSTYHVIVSHGAVWRNSPYLNASVLLKAGLIVGKKVEFILPSGESVNAAISQNGKIWGKWVETFYHDYESDYSFSGDPVYGEGGTGKVISFKPEGFTSAGEITVIRLEILDQD